MSYQTDITVIGGLPVTVEYTVAPAEPDVGIFSAYVDDWYIVAINGRDVKRCAWLDKRIAETPGELDRIRGVLDEEANEAGSDYWEY